jgi:hypothetical protein
MHLKTPDGQTAVVVGGSVPAVHDGWMWDLTVPGNNDHDFYVEPATVLPPTQTGSTTVAVLVHNCGGALQMASDAAKAAADDPDSIFIKNKHLASFGGRYAKFATDNIGEAQSWVSEALDSDGAVFKPNSLDGTFKVETDLGRAVGTNGQTGIRAIVSNDGRVINAFPFNP